MNVRGSFVVALLTLALAGCKPKTFDVEPPIADWVVKSRVGFYEADGRTARPIPKEKLRLWMPYVVGDLYGSPNAGEIQPVELAPDLGFTLNLNLNHLRLAKALVPTEFSQKWLSIEPKDARVARLSPFVLPADGIAPYGVTEWLEEGSGNRLMLVYIDRPARIRGEIVYDGRDLRFDISVPEAGYVWIRQPEGSGAFMAIPKPENVILAVFPGT